MRVLHAICGAARSRAARAAAALTVLVLVIGCAPGIVLHAFSFDVSDAPGVQILDYRYGDSRQPSARADPAEIASGERIRQSVNIMGDIKRPDSLYVRWRDTSSGKIYEDTVDLARLLPRNIKNHRIHFIVRNSQLFVYLITPEKRGVDEPAIGPLEYQYRKVILLAADSGHEVTNN